MVSKLFLFSLLIVVLISAATSMAAHLGGYKPIKDLNDPYVVKIAKFAVSEHNKHTSMHLALVAVVRGQEQVVAGTNYKLYISAKVTNVRKSDIDLPIVTLYEADVYDEPSAKHRSLTSFKEAQKMN